MKDHPGARVRRVRRMLEITPTELAAKVGVSTGHITGFESGTRTISGSLLARIADELDVPVEELSGDEPFQSPVDRAYGDGFHAGYEQALADAANGTEIGND
ncbi:helix-turn-helix domain-containing protein [Miltoncostaea marina]|uniref:helix-turn-helix domain-containing protein n=1 Tax=Miltoncostaea marina TaxID=2843215 RepID=UPI001C3E12FD|nr:helix-turn-helix transcriptional regulator [Miltoncostaea marina]